MNAARTRAPRGADDAGATGARCAPVRVLTKGSGLPSRRARTTGRRPGGCCRRATVALRAELTARPRVPRQAPPATRPPSAARRDRVPAPNVRRESSSTPRRQQGRVVRVRRHVDLVRAGEVGVAGDDLVRGNPREVLVGRRVPWDARVRVVAHQQQPADEQRQREAVGLGRAFGHRVALQLGRRVLRRLHAAREALSGCRARRTASSRSRGTSAGRRG